MTRPGVVLRALTAVVLAVLVTVPAEPASARDEITPRAVSLAMPDGVTLAGTLVVRSAPAVRPAVVLVSPWGTPDTVYLAQAVALAQRGYLVLSYTNRGFGGSGGLVTLAGPREVADVSSVIDWMLAHTTADPDRIGVGGVSYGAGISLLAAGHDPRIKAVVAFSGWTDLTETFYRDGTRASAVIGSVRFFVEATGRPAPELTAVFRDFFAGRDAAAIRRWTRIRSPVAYLDRINTYRPAIYLAQAYGDTFFTPNQITDFSTQLTGPHHLELSPGDHGTPEASGLLGAPNPLWTNAARWLDRYVAGLPSGIDREPSVLLRGRPDEQVEGYADWSRVGARVERYALGPGRRTLTLTRRAPPRSDWRYRIRTGYGTTADAGFVVITNWFESLTGIPPVVWLPTVGRCCAGVWLSPPLTDPAPVRGTVRLHLTRDQPAGTIIAYLYDVGPLDLARLVAHEPQTWRGGDVRDLRFPALRHDIPAGHRLGLVVDTVDPLYGDRGPRGGRLTFTGPSWLDLPLR